MTLKEFLKEKEKEWYEIVKEKLEKGEIYLDTYKFNNKSKIEIYEDIKEKLKDKLR